MRAVVAGGNGFIGRELTAQLVAAGHEVVWLSHRAGRADQQPPDRRPTSEVAFDPADPAGDWAKQVAGADAVVNLAGYSISARWNPRTKALIESSRMESTAALVDAIASARSGGTGPSALINASAVGFYGEGGERELTEDMDPGSDWLASVCVRWENEARRAEDSGVRVVRIRTGIVMGAEGALPA